MKLLNLVVLAAAAAIPAQACKCIDSNGGQNAVNTQFCCASLDGSFQFGDDCAASSISQHLSNFRSCCRIRGSQTSDCNFPSKGHWPGALAYTFRTPRHVVQEM
ncbi:uncharacterized protein BXZ73DRAFT_101504 [Epithele typhae]|uniref:uncharacterized protein n=1 Tax=Epithele typhae TaxID=378194 RepID=UPI002007B0F6|nr:uncharacterized protein BXZ73DRAFT_101504 [Epithele typhae]KAH9932129.1 hypothetical protein BXZ73DRAFT_101504 [Epithele typhae]